MKKGFSGYSIHFVAISFLVTVEVERLHITALQQMCTVCRSLLSSTSVTTVEIQVRSHIMVKYTLLELPYHVGHSKASCSVGTCSLMSYTQSQRTSMCVQQMDDFTECILMKHATVLHSHSLTVLSSHTLLPL